jgi:hypothetical protein
VADERWAQISRIYDEAAALAPDESSCVSAQRLW